MTTAHSMKMKFHRNAEMTESLNFVILCPELSRWWMQIIKCIVREPRESLICENELRSEVWRCPFPQYLKPKYSGPTLTSSLCRPAVLGTKKTLQ